MDKYTLKLRQAMTLDDKIRFTERRIHEWVKEFGEDGCYISFSGGKDSTVLLDIVRNIYPNIEAVFVDTGLEYPEIRKFVKTKSNVTWLRPKTNFKDVIEKFGYPIISKEVSECIDRARKSLTTNKYLYHIEQLNGTAIDKNGNLSIYNKPQWKFLLDAPFKISNKCCSIMKKKPVHDFYKQTNKTPIIGTMAEESRLRKQQYLKQGCNGFNNKIPTSTPIAFWTEQDVLQYLYEKKIPYASVYGDILKQDKYYTTGCKRTGCIFCGFGCHLEKYPNRFQKLAETHPSQYKYVMNDLGFKDVLNFINVDIEPRVDKAQLKLF